MRDLDESGLVEGSPRLPRSFGAYTLFDVVGRGGMAQIYLARAETELGATRLAVVKQILPAFAGDPRFAEMLIHEAKLAARLSHRHIVQVIDLGRHDEHLFIAMEYVEGLDLNALLRKCSDAREGLPTPHALAIVADVLAALDYAHRRADDDGAPLGIVHRDVSPSNVLVSFEGEVKLCDFGIAHANDLVKEEAGDALKGKAGYMSPEHARGEPLDARADVFAAGILLWELLAGRRLYRSRSDVPLLEQARRAEIPPLPDKGLPRSEELEAVVKRALATSRDERYPSAVAMLRDLEAYVAEVGLSSNRLELGKWMTSTFGAELIEQRRASERRLPKSAKFPRASDRMPVPSDALTSAAAPSEPPAFDAPDASPALDASDAVLPPHAVRASGTPSQPSEMPSPPEMPSARPDVAPNPFLLREGTASSLLASSAPVAPPPKSGELAHIALEDEGDSAPILPPRRPLPVSEGAIRAFVRELEAAPASRVASEPGSLGGAALDAVIGEAAPSEPSLPDLDAARDTRDSSHVSRLPAAQSASSVARLMSPRNVAIAIVVIALIVAAIIVMGPPSSR